MSSTRALATLYLVTIVLLAATVAPVGASVVSTSSTAVGNASSIDVADATIDAGSPSSLEIAYNATGQVGAAGDLALVVATSSGVEVYKNTSVTAMEGTTNYTLSANELSVNETLTATLENRTSGSVLATDSATITVQAPRLTASASANATDVAVGDTVEFDGTGSSLTAGYSWDVRTGGSTILNSPVASATYNHTFSSSGVYVGNLTVSDGTGHVDHDEVTVVVGDNAAPVAALDAFPSPAAANETVQLYAGESSDDVAIKQFEWDWTGDGSYETTTTPSSPGGGAYVTHAYTAAGTYSPTVRVTDYAGNTHTASATLTVRPEPNVTSTSVTWTGNGTKPSGTIAANASTSGGMFVFYLHPQGARQNMDLSTVGADATSELWVNFTVENYEPDAVMGGANLHEWNTSPNSQGAGTNFSVRLQPVELQRNTSFTGMDPNRWQSKYDRANVGIDAGVYLGAFDMPDGTPFESNMTGATLTSDAQAFMPPRYDQQAGRLNYSVAAPHWKKDLDGSGNKVQNTGFYEAVIPSGMVSWMGIQNPGQLAGTYRSGGSTTDLSNMEVVSREDGDLYINVTGIHYSSGTVSLSKDSTAPTASVDDASGTVGDAVSFDASGSADNRQIDTYEWDWDGDGSYDASTSSATATHTYSSSGSYTVTLRVTDGAGNTATDTATASIEAASSTSSVHGSGGTYTTTTVTPTETATPTETTTPAGTAAGTTTGADGSSGTDGQTTDRSTDTESPEAAPETTGGDEEQPSPTESSGQPGFGLLVALVALLAVGVLARRRQ